MRTKFLTAITSLAMVFGMAACSSSDDLSIDNNGSKDGATTGYLNVNIREMSEAGGVSSAKSAFTRAENPQGDGIYESGNADEGRVGKVRFYFYTADNNPYVLANCPTPGGNYLEHDFNGDNQTGDDSKTIESKTKALLVLNGTKENVTPAKVVAVVNYETLGSQLPNGSLSLSTVKAITNVSTVYTSEKKDFVMTNSVYPGTEANSINLEQDISDKIFPSRSDAEKDGNEAEIYVERVAAKVTVGPKSESTAEPTKDTWGSYNGNPAFLVDTVDVYTIGGAGVSTRYAVMAVVQGWGLADETLNANLFKDITDWNSWAYKLDGLTANSQLSTMTPLWTVSDYKRCFWEITPKYSRKNWKWNEIVGTSATNGAKFGDGNPLYTLPNTPDHEATTFPSSDDVNRRNTVNNIDAHDLTKVIVPAVLYCKQIGEGDNEWKVAKLVRYRGKYYLAGEGEGAEETLLKQLIAKDYSYVYTDAECTKPISTADVVINAPTYNGQKTDYQQTIQLAGDATRTYYVKRDPTETTYDSEVHGGDQFSDYGDYVMNYADGRTYYYTTIQHLWADGDPTTKLGYFGVVRNHWYKITINSLAGPGTPVPNPDVPIVPVTPQESLSYMTARINVLQWRVVKQAVDINGNTKTSAKKRF